MDGPAALQSRRTSESTLRKASAAESMRLVWNAPLTATICGSDKLRIGSGSRLGTCLHFEGTGTGGRLLHFQQCAGVA